MKEKRKRINKHGLPATMGSDPKRITKLFVDGSHEDNHLWEFTSSSSPMATITNFDLDLASDSYDIPIRVMCFKSTGRENLNFDISNKQVK